MAVNCNRTSTFTIATETDPTTATRILKFSVLPRTRWIAKMKDEGLGRSAAYNWPRKLERLGKVTIEDDYCTRRLT